MVPELEAFREEILHLKDHPLISPLLVDDQLSLAQLSISDTAALLKNSVAYYFLIAAANLNRTSLRKSVQEPDAQIVSSPQRPAYVIRKRIPVHLSFGATVAKAVALRTADLSRKSRGEIEQLFRDRLAAERIPLLMSPPARSVPGLLIPRRKPDGVYPDPASGKAPKVYLEIKNVQRVADDIQKRLYEIAEASIEMKVVYGRLRLRGLNSKNTLHEKVVPTLRKRIRTQIINSQPTVVALFLCSRKEAERYRAGAETFVDRVFFQEEIEECLAFLQAAVKKARRTQ